MPTPSASNRQFLRGVRGRVDITRKNSQTRTCGAAAALITGVAWAQPTLERIPIPGYQSVTLYGASGDGRWVTGFVADSTGWRAFRASTSTFEALDVPPHGCPLCPSPP